MAHIASEETIKRREIEAKADKILAEKAFKKKCLEAEICPDCGKDLKIEPWDESEFTDGVCKPCGKKYLL